MPRRRVKRRGLLGPGMLFVAGGILSILAGSLGMIRFLAQTLAVDRFTVAELVRGLVLPHMLALAGLAVVFYGIVLIAQAVIFRRRGPPEGEEPEPGVPAKK